MKEFKSDGNHSVYLRPQQSNEQDTVKTSHTFPSSPNYCFTRKAYGDSGTSAGGGVTTWMALKAQGWLKMGSCVMLEGM